MKIRDLVLDEEEKAEKRLKEAKKKKAVDPFKKDIHQIDLICESYDLRNAQSNRKLYSKLRKGNAFSSWIGNAFLFGLKSRSVSSTGRRLITTILKTTGVCAIIVAILLAAVLYLTQVEKERKEAVLEYIRQERLLADSGQLATSKDGKVMVLEEYQTVYSMYPDMVGWLKIPDTNVDYPVMQNLKNEDYYLTHNFEGKDDNAGALFISADASVDPKDDAIIIYGHDTNNDSIFGGLKYYQDYEYYIDHKTLFFDTLYERGKYEVVAVVLTRVLNTDETGFRYYWLTNYEDTSDYDDFCDFIEENSIFEISAHSSIKLTDEIIMLSTCDSSREDGRLVIIAKKVE